MYSSTLILGLSLLASVQSDTVTAGNFDTFTIGNYNTYSNGNSFSFSNDISIGGSVNGLNCYQGHCCKGSIFAGCDSDISNAFCCVGDGLGGQNICIKPSPTTCAQGSMVALTSFGSGTTQMTSAPTSGNSPAQVTASTTTTSDPNAATTTSSASGTGTTGNAAAGGRVGMMPGYLGLGMIATAYRALAL